MRICLIIQLAFIAGAFADTIRLKNGEVLEGKIVASTPQEIVIQVQVTSSILDERVVPRSEVAHLDQKREDEIEFQKLKDLRPDATVISVAAYDEVLKKQLEPFLEKYSYSTYAPEVKRIASQFQSEKARMEASGEVKVRGKWISGEEFEKNRYEIVSGVLLETMKSNIRAGDLPSAMNLFFQIEKEYPKSSAFPEALALAIENLPKLEAQAQAQMRSLEITLDQRRRGYAIAPPEEKLQIDQAIEREDNQRKAILAAAKARGMKFPPWMPDSQEALELTKSTAKSEAARLAGLPLDKMREGANSAKEASRLLERGELPAASSSLAAAKTAWPDFVLLQELEERLKRAESIALESSKRQQEYLEQEKKDAADAKK